MFIPSSLAFLNVTLGILGGPLVVISTFLVVKVVVLKVAMCHQRTISGCESMISLTKFTLVHASHVILCIITHFISNLLYNWVHSLEGRMKGWPTNCFNSQCVLQDFIIRHVGVTSNYKSHLCSNANFCSITVIIQYFKQCPLT